MASGVDGGGPSTFPQLLLRQARERGGQPAFRDKSRGIWRTTTWAEFAEETAALAAALAARGLRRGDRLALLGDNRVRLYAAIAAAHRLGAVAMPLFRDAPAATVASQLRSAAATHVFAEDQEQVDKVLAVLRQCPAVRCIVHDKDRGMRHYAHPQLVGYAELRRHGRELSASPRDHEVESGAGDEPAFLIFTAGTTGEPKGVVLSHGAVLAPARAAASAARLSGDDVGMAYLPPAWLGQTQAAYALPLLTGLSVCCPESAQTMLADMREVCPTFLLATPRVLEAMRREVFAQVEDAGPAVQALHRRCLAVGRRVDEGTRAGTPASLADRLAFRLLGPLMRGPLRDLLGMGRVRLAYTAGDAVAPDTLLFFRSLGVDLRQLYGVTEAGFFVAIPRDLGVRPGSVGGPVEGVELEFTPGRGLLLRSADPFGGYLGDHARTEAATEAQGRLRTGDVGELGADGQLRILGREDEVGTFTDGTVFAPALIESSLRAFPFIREAVAVHAGRDMVCALVDIEEGAVRAWADRRGVPYTGHADLASRAEVYELVADCVARVNAEAAQGPPIRRFVVLPRDLRAEEGEITPMGTVRRHVVLDRFRGLVAAMRDGRSAAPLDGIGDPAAHPAAASAELRIGDIAPSEPMRSMAAA